LYGGKKYLSIDDLEFIWVLALPSVKVLLVRSLFGIMRDMDETEIESHKQDAKIFYDNLGSMYCPIVGEYVVFGSVGYRHLFYKSRRQRLISEQLIRLVYLRYAPEVIAESTYIHEVRRSPTGRVMTYALAHKTRSGVVVRVILQRINQDVLVFLSVMPHRRG
jgi:hypothetical protein